MKKNLQLGMNAGTASHRLVKDILFKFVIAAGHKCFRCGGDLTRDTFSIEHKEPWLDSKNPTKMFFDLDNIAFSHKLCNYSAKRTSNKKYFSEKERRIATNTIQRDVWARMGKEKQRQRRREKYERNGC